jgi:cyanobactin maturation PatA/PatG family protease
MNQVEGGTIPNHFDVNTIPGISNLWNRTSGEKGICIAIIDGDIDRTHSCFNDANIRSIDLFNSSSRQSADTFALEHGTSVASIIFGSHNSVIKGIAPGCNGIIVPVFIKKDNGQTACSQLDLARAIQVADANGANIINISGGEFSPTGKSDVLLSNTIAQCIKKGILIVSAVGNDGCECLHVPASESAVLAVGAMDENNKPLTFSNWGKAYQSNGIIFPGKDILTAVLNNGVSVKSGTSYATPIASGIAALLLSLMSKAGLKPDGKMVYDALLRTAIRCDRENEKECEKTLVGYVNLPAAVQYILERCEIAEDPEEFISNRILAASNKTTVMLSEYHNFLPDQNTQSKTNSINKKKEEPIMSETDKVLELSGLELPETVKPSQMPQNIYSAANSGAAAVKLSDCGCGCQKNTESQNSEVALNSNSDNSGSVNSGSRSGNIVYAIGTLGYEFRTESSKDSFQQAMNANPYDPTQLLRYLDENPEANEDVLWTLNLDATPIYVIFPFGGFAEAVYRKLRDFYREQLAGNASRISVPGTLVGSTRIISGQELPIIMPKGQGMFSWTTAALIEAVVGSAPEASDASALQDFTDKTEGLENFLDRVYYELRNLGMTPEERALNFAATNAFQMDRVFEKAAGESLELDTIDVEKSPICKPGSDCWDVKLVFFNPERRTQQARRIYRFTIDVSNVIPVTVGGIRSWNIY